MSRFARKPLFWSRETGFVSAVAVAVAIFGLSGCGTGDRDSASEGCTYSYECFAGYVCVEGTCRAVVDPVVGGDASDTGGADADAGDVGADVPGFPDAGDTDAGGADAGGADGGQADGGEEQRITFGPSQYRRCFDDLECAVFGGNCLTYLPLSRGDGPGGTGTVTRVKLSDISNNLWDGQGICTLSCTADPRICDAIVATGPGGESVPYSCQLLHVGTSPYPTTPPPLPFDDQLNPDLLARGISFGSICRPPFHRSEERSETFCQRCVTDGDCALDDHCFIEQPFASSPRGSCVEPCTQDSTCPVGFTCRADDGDPSAEWCLPIAGTCGYCLDRDGDLRGAGRCGPTLDHPYTEVDCDDTNPEIYYSTINPKHAFPERCGNIDYNCNGISDETEQLGSEEHCSGCGDVCRGIVPRGVKKCRQPTGGTWRCIAVCEPGAANCDDNLENGCETEVDASSVVFQDKDADGRGDDDVYRWQCPGAPVDPGWVTENGDCDDNDPTVYSNAPELCDGKDNNCNGAIDDPASLWVGGVSPTCAVPGELGVCEAGHEVCHLVAKPDGTEEKKLECVPDIDIVLAKQSRELCDDVDHNCDGDLTRGADYRYETIGAPGAPVECIAEEAIGNCRKGTYQCKDVAETKRWVCAAGAPSNVYEDPTGNIDYNCDGFVGSKEQTIFVRTAGEGTLGGKDTNNGGFNAPVATLKRAIELACAGGGLCKDIVMASGTYTTNQTLTIPNRAYSTTDERRYPVRIYGGYEPGLVCSPTCVLTWLRKVGSRSVLERQGPTKGTGSYPFGEGYAALTGDGGTAGLSLMLDQIEVAVSGPPGVFVLESGENAPAMTGIQCPSAGCYKLRFRNSVISVDSGLPGGPGTAGAFLTQAASDVMNGRNACASNQAGCDPYSRYTGDWWMSYKSSGCPNNLGDTKKYDGMGAQGASCPSGGTPSGGSSGGVRCLPSSGGSRTYHFGGVYGTDGGTSGGGGGSYGWWSTDQRTGNSDHGGNGWAGGAGRYGQTSITLNSTRFLKAPSVTAAGRGGNGGGGGGGGGCLIPGANNWQCPLEIRGSGGGAGGCGGNPGSAGGHGGSVVGIHLKRAGASGCMLDVDGAFAIIVGEGGAGGKGGAGGSGTGGGWAGVTTSTAPQWTEGGNGGNGAGGGGGAGGFGGHSICMMHEGGSFPLAAFIEALPETICQTGRSLAQGGVGGDGGAGGSRGAQASYPRRTENTTSKGSAGAAGAGGVSRVFLDCPNSLPSSCGTR